MTRNGTGRPEGVDRRLARLFVVVMSLSLTVASLIVLLFHRFEETLRRWVRRS